MARLNGDYQTNGYNRKAAMQIFYLNPNRSFDSFKLGGNVRVNGTWLMGTNMTSTKLGNKLSMEAHIDLPHPNKNTHSIVGSLEQSTEYPDGFAFFGQYKDKNSPLVYKGSGDVSYGNKQHITGKVDMTFGQKNLDTFVDYKVQNNVTDVLFKIKALRKEMLQTKFTYRPWEDFHNIT